MEVFFIKYRKLLRFASVFMLFYFLYEMYKGVTGILTNHIGEGIGTFINAGIAIFVSVYFFINIRKAERIKREKEVA